MVRVVRVAHACAANRALDVGAYATTFQEVSHVSAKSRWRIDLDSIPFESYKLSRVAARIRASPPSPHIRQLQSLEGIGKGERGGGGGEGVCATGYLVHVREKFCHETLFAFIVGVSLHRIISSEATLLSPRTIIPRVDSNFG